MNVAVTTVSFSMVNVSGSRLQPDRRSNRAVFVAGTARGNFLAAQVLWLGGVIETLPGPTLFRLQGVDVLGEHGIDCQIVGNRDDLHGVVTAERAAPLLKGPARAAVGHQALHVS